MNPSLCKSPQDCPQVLIPELLRLCILPRCQDPQPNLCPRLHIGGRRTPNSVPLIYRTARAHCAVRFRTPNPHVSRPLVSVFPFSQCCLGELFQQTPGFSLPRLCRRLCPEAPPSRPKHDLAHVGTQCHLAGAGFITFPVFGCCAMRRFRGAVMPLAFMLASPVSTITA